MSGTIQQKLLLTGKIASLYSRPSQRTTPSRQGEGAYSGGSLFIPSGGGTRMNRLIVITGMTLLTACLIGWAALASAQPGIDKLTATDDLSAQVSSMEAGGETAHLGGISIRPRATGPSAALSAVLPPPATKNAAAPSGKSMSAAPASSPAVKAPAMVQLSPLPSQQPMNAAPLGQIPTGPSGSLILSNQATESPSPMQQGSGQPGDAGAASSESAPQPLNGADRHRPTAIGRKWRCQWAAGRGRFVVRQRGTCAGVGHDVREHGQSPGTVG